MEKIDTREEEVEECGTCCEVDPQTMKPTC